MQDIDLFKRPCSDNIDNIENTDNLDAITSTCKRFNQQHEQLEKTFVATNSPAYTKAINQELGNVNARIDTLDLRMAKVGNPTAVTTRRQCIGLAMPIN